MTTSHLSPQQIHGLRQALADLQDMRNMGKAQSLASQLEGLSYVLTPEEFVEEAQETLPELIELLHLTEP